MGKHTTADLGREQIIITPMQVQWLSLLIEPMRGRK